VCASRRGVFALHRFLISGGMHSSGWEAVVVWFVDVDEVKVKVDVQSKSEKSTFQSDKTSQFKE